MKKGILKCPIEEDMSHEMPTRKGDNKKMSKKHRLKSMSMEEFSDRYVRPDIPTRCKWMLHDEENNKADPHHHIKFDPMPPKIMPNILHNIGRTPLVKLNVIPREFGVKCEVLVKCEFFNAGGSVKDRIGYRMVLEAEKDGKIKPGDILIEPTSGNTGIGIALAAAVKGYKCIIVMPEKMSSEKVNVLRALGAEIVRTPNAASFDSPESHIGVAQRLNHELKNSIILDQYRNPGNPLAHYDGTAEEILYQCDDKVDMLVASAGTGGTITGLSRKLKERVPDIEIVGVDPLGSILAEPESINESDVTFYEVEGIGYDFIPTVLDRKDVDSWVKTHDKDSLLMSRNLIRKEGLLCGGSCGATVWAAMQSAKKLREDQRCVVILADSVRNYMTKFLDDDWMAERDFIKHDISPGEEEWWWSHKMTALDLQTPLTVVPQMKCQSAIDIMNKETFDQLPVVNEGGYVLGMVTLGNLMGKMVSGKITPESTVSECIYDQFKKVSLSSSLYELSRVLDRDYFALVVHCQKLYSDLNKSSEKQIIFGIVTRMDLLNYITKNHPDVNKDKESDGMTTENECPAHRANKTEAAK